MSDLQQQQSSEGGGSEQQQQQAIVVPVPGGGETSVVPGAAPASEERIKLFVGQIPRAYTEKELRQMFEQFGPVVDVHVLTDKFTGNSKGCGFVVFSQQAAADSAMSTLHNQVTLPGMHNAVQVKPADSEQGKDERKLFIGMISRETTEEDVRMMFGPYGTIEDCTILRSQDGVSRCCGFVRMATRAQALAAIEKLHHSQTLPNCRSPMVVKFADSDKDRQAKRRQQQFNMPYGMGPQMGFFNPMMQAGRFGQAGFGAPDMTQAYAGMQMYAQTGLAGQAYQAGGGGGTVAKQPEGPDGANLFIYHLPQEFNDSALQATFAPFGNVVSARVFIDKHTGQSKGFGFVSYDNAQSAMSAITAMNGFQIGTKRLKVQIKRPRGVPY